MAASSTKDKVLEAIRDLPPDATVEDAMERLYFLAKVQRGLVEADAGDTIPHSEVASRLSRG